MKSSWNSQDRKPVTKLRTLVILFFLLFLMHGAAEGQSADKTRQYLYEDTKQLVTLVEDAAGIMEKRGREAFGEFGRIGSRWLNQKYYLFVYDIQGTCVFHPITPELIGRNLMAFRDMNGKPVIQYITDIGRKPERDASGWVFYLWEEGTQFVPQWKSSYIRKVIAPDGNIYVLGCGSYNIKIEKVFVQGVVKTAAELIKVKGKAAFEDLRRPGSPFHFLGNYVFVMDINGHSRVDPAYPMLIDRDLTNFRDAVGRYVVKEMIRKLQTDDEAWVQYLWPKPGTSLPSRKLVYIRKVRVENETLIVGSDFFLATPVWMRP